MLFCSFRKSIAICRCRGRFHVTRFMRCLVERDASHHIYWYRFPLISHTLHFPFRSPPFSSFLFSQFGYNTYRGIFCDRIWGQSIEIVELWWRFEEEKRQRQIDWEREKKIEEEREAEKDRGRERGRERYREEKEIDRGRERGRER